MSRPIKFRVWDIKQQRYLATDNGIHYQLYPTYEECREREEGRGVGFRPLGHCIMETERFVVEQFTGLTDDYQGREIYEGDIVQFRLGKGTDFDAHQKVIAKVEWESEMAAFQIHDHVQGVLYFISTAQRGSLKVVGNIHEDDQKWFGVARA